MSITINEQVSNEIASAAEPTSGLLDGSARERRNRRILARALKSVTVKYGVTLAQAIQEEKAETQLRPAVVATLPADADEAEAVEDVAVPGDEFEDVPAARVVPVRATVLFTQLGHHMAAGLRDASRGYVCRGCGASGRFGYVLDRQGPCARPFVSPGSARAEAA